MLLPAVQQILRFEDHAPAPPSQTPVAIVGRFHQPATRLLSRLRSKQQCQSEPYTDAQQKARHSATIALVLTIVSLLGVIVPGAFFITHDALSNRYIPDPHIPALTSHISQFL